VEIRCDPRNERSAAVPRRLGFEHVATLAGDRAGRDGIARDTMVWQLTAPLTG
jgi:RimJ/RimL family protein N-acetyltransferase